MPTLCNPVNLNIKIPVGCSEGYIPSLSLPQANMPGMSTIKGRVNQATAPLILENKN
jgi:hypothetical protein